jgi:hypothetical protein
MNNNNTLELINGLSVRDIQVLAMSSRCGKAAPNQVTLVVGPHHILKSYGKTIAVIDYGSGKTWLDSYYHNYSRTTIRYRNQFLGEDSPTVKRRIENGDIIMADLN